MYSLGMFGSCFAKMFLRSISLRSAESSQREFGGTKGHTAQAEPKLQLGNSFKPLLWSAPHHVLPLSVVRNHREGQLAGLLLHYTGGYASSRKPHLKGNSSRRSFWAKVAPAV